MFKPHFPEHSNDAVFHLQEPLSLEETARLRKAFWEVINHQTIHRLILNFNEIATIDSAVISLLVATKSLLTRIKGDFILVGLNHSHIEFLEKINLYQYFDIRPDLEACAPIPAPKLK